VTHPDYLDTLGIWDAVVGLPEQMQTALAASADVLGAATLPPGEALRNIAVLGMGSAGAVGDLVAAYGADRASVPIWVGKGYGVPAFVGEHTLVFAISWSGTTEETLAAAREALQRGAPVIVVSGGGALGELAANSDLVQFALPGHLSASRTSLGAMSVPVLMTLSHLGLVPDVAGPLNAAIFALQRRRDALVAPQSPVEEVARRVGRTIPLVYGSTGCTAVAAQRWKSQINENAKTPAFAAELPEVSHNEVAGWGQHGDITRQVLSLIALRHAAEHPQVARQFSLVIDATDEVMANVIPVWAEGPDDLSRFFDLVLFGDLVSLHLAGREDIDPGPVPASSDVEAALR
jgi:glucose/mannose-6-phosphate isomerase